MPSLAFVVVAWLYCWLITSDGMPWNWGDKQGDYYNLLIDGFLDGHLYMKAEVPKALLEHPNPYNPALRPGGLGLHDASYYQGRYYLYFGAAPALVTMLPFKLVTGTDLPLRAAVLFFTLLGYGASLACLLAIRNRYFGETSWPLFAFCALALGGANFAPVILRRASLWELPISAGYAFSMLALWLVYLSLHDERRVLRWYFLAGLSLGLAVASRLSYMYSCALLLAPAAYWWSRMQGSFGVNWRRACARLAVGFFPVAVVGLCMAWYNFARFGDPLEFGVRYQLSGINEAVVKHFRPSYFPYDQFLYLWQPAEWTPYFPFIQLPAQPPPPTGHLGSEHLYGFFTNMPFGLLAFALPLAWFRRAKEEGAVLKVWGLSAGFLAAAVAGTLLFYLAAMSRYSMDFAAATILLACVAALATQRALSLQGPLWLRRAAVSLLCLTSASSVFFCLMYGFEIQGLFRTFGYPRYAQLAKLCNYPTHWAQKALGTRFGPIELQLEFPAAPKAGREVLLRTGSYHARDFVFVEYDGGGGARLGYSHLGGAERLGRSLVFDKGKVARLKISLGSLYPPEEHPYFESHSPETRRRVELFLNDEPMILAYQRTYDASPFSIAAGAEAADERMGRPFSGKLLGTSPALAAELPSWSMRIWANLGSDKGGKQTPLLVTKGPKSKTFLVRRVGAETAVVECRTQETTAWESAPFSLGASPSHEMELRWTPAMLSVSCDDLVVGKIPATLFALDELKSLTPARRDADSDRCAVFELEESSSDAEGRATRLRTLNLRLRLPSAPTQFREPLVVTGYAGRGDFLLIEYAGPDKVRFHLDHWGKLPVSSDTVSLEYDKEHLFEIRMGSFPGATLDEGGLGELFLSVDGKKIFDQRARFYGVSPSDVFVGRNPIGGSSAARFFTGTLLSIRKNEPGTPGRDASR